MDENKELKNYFFANHQRISITTDTWTLVNNMGYMVLTGHWVDVNWVLQKKDTKFFSNSKSQRGWNWKIDLDLFVRFRDKAFDDYDS